MDASDVAAWVKAARESKGWTQQQLGDALGLSKANVSHWETEKHEPSFIQLLKIRDLTGHPLTEVAGRRCVLPDPRLIHLTS